MSVSRIGLLAFASLLQLVAGQSRIDIPVVFDSSGRYVVPVSLVSDVNGPLQDRLAHHVRCKSTGSSQESLNFTISMSTGVIYVAGPGGNGMPSSVKHIPPTCS